MQSKPSKNILSFSIKKAAYIFILLVLTAIAAVLVTPKYSGQKKPAILENAIPKQFGAWQYKPNTYAQVSVNTFAQAISDAIYDQVLMRTYEDKSGKQVMLAIAFAAEQRQEIKIHQPEVCYPAQGFKMLSIKDHEFKLASYPTPIRGKQLIFKKGSKMEAVSYWIRLGNSFPMSGFEMRVKILKEGLKGKIDDGVLVRVSTLIDDESGARAAYQLQEKFLTDLISGVEVFSPNLLAPLIVK